MESLIEFYQLLEFALCLDDKPTYCLGFGNCLIASYPSALLNGSYLCLHLWVKHVCKAHGPHGKHTLGCCEHILFFSIRKRKRKSPSLWQKTRLKKVISVTSR